MPPRPARGSEPPSPPASGSSSSGSSRGRGSGFPESPAGPPSRARGSEPPSPPARGSEPPPHPARGSEPPSPPASAPPSSGSPRARGSGVPESPSAPPRPARGSDSASAPPSSGSPRGRGSGLPESPAGPPRPARGSEPPPPPAPPSPRARAGGYPASPSSPPPGGRDSAPPPASAPRAPEPPTAPAPRGPDSAPPRPPASAAAPPGVPPRPGDSAPPAPRAEPPAYRAPAPWVPLAAPSGPVTFPSAPKPPEAGPSATRASTESSNATVSASDKPSAAPEAGGGPVAGAAPHALAYVGDGPPTYEAEPTGLPAADPDDLGSLVADTVLDGARYGSSTLRAASLRGDSARYRGEPRRDALLTARFGAGDDALVLVAMATGARATAGAHRAAADACGWIGRAVGRSHARLAQDIRAARRGDLKSGLHRLTDRSLGKLRARAAELGLEPEEYTASLRCLLLPADPRCRTRVFFGVGSGGLFRLRGGEWQDIEPRVATTTGAPVVGFGSPSSETPDGDRLTMDLGITTPPSPYEPALAPPRDPFRFRASVARPGDTLLLCTGGLAEPLRGEPELARHLTRRWAEGGPPGLAAFLADTQVRVKGYADDRTAAAVWEA
ncbi:protein phosphatase 2C domain-containing protein [Streptomyces sp. PmtG]